MRFSPYVSGLYGIIHAPVYRFILDKHQQLRLFDSFVPHGLDCSFNHRALAFVQESHLYIGDYIPMTSYNSYAAVRLPDESYVVIGPLDFGQTTLKNELSTPADNNVALHSKKQLDNSMLDNSKLDSSSLDHSSPIQPLVSSQEWLQLKLRTVNLWCEMICQIVVRQELPPENESQIYNDADELIPQYLKKIAKEVPLKAPHNQYRYELATLDAIRNGDVEMVDRSFSIPLKGKFGILAQDPLRSMKNHVHNLATLASRAAISSGILPERAFALSDKFFMASEECNTIEQCEDLRRLCARSFAQMVKEYRMTKQQESNPLVRDMMLIISRELFNHFTAQDLAQRLNHSYEHLERIFKAHTGLSLALYIKQEKLKQAQELIRDTQDSVADIAHILGFASASHFTRAFKSYCGLTPRQYRKVFSSEHVG